MKKNKLTLIQKRSLSGYMFILPWVLGFTFFYIRSLVMTVQFSLSEMTVSTGGGYSLVGVGFQNFIYAFREHATFKQVLTTSVSNMLMDVPMIIFFSLMIALLLKEDFKGRTLVRAIFFLPVIMNSDAIVDALELSRTMMNGGLTATSGETANAIGSGISIGYYISMFKDLAIPDQFLDYIVGVVGRINAIITASGVQIIIFIAALQSIPRSMYEVAKIEGATSYETFWKVTFPMVMPHIITNIVYTVVVNFADSDIVQLAYNTAFSESNYGLSSAISVVSTLITCFILVMVVGLIQKRTFYYN